MSTPAPDAAPAGFNQITLLKQSLPANSACVSDMTESWMKSLFTSARLEVQKRNVEVQIPSLSVIVELFESCVSVFLVMFIEVLIRLNGSFVSLQSV